MPFGYCSGGSSRTPVEGASPIWCEAVLQEALRNAVKYSGVRPVRLLVYDAGEMSWVCGIQEPASISIRR
jgi:hypothetical protein